MVASAAGLVALIVGAGFGIDAILKRNASNDGPCNAADFCNSDGIRLRADAMRSGVVSTATLFAGAAAASSGIALFFTAPTPGRPQIGLAAGPGSLRLTGRWW